MANSNAPFGFRLFSSATGAAPNFPLAKATIAYNDTTKIYSGDPVKMTATGGQIAQWTAATEASQLWGIFRGCKYLSSAQGKVVYSNFWPGADVASTAQTSIEAFIEPITMAATPLFVVQSGSAGCAANKLGTGNTFNGQSGAYLHSTFTTTVTLPFRVMGLYGVGVYAVNNVGPGSESGAYNWVIVAANNVASTGI